MAYILMTGASGYIGSHTAYQFLKQSDYDIVIVDNLSTGFEANFTYLSNMFKGRVHLYKLDIGDIVTLRKIIRQYEFKAVIHFAASLVVSQSVELPLQYYINNTVKTTQLIALMIESGIENMIFSSTAAVYGEPKSELIPIGENAPLMPINPYGASKMMSERVMFDSALAYKHFHYVALRYFNVAGASMDNTTQALQKGVGLGQRSKNATHLIKVACECACGKRAKMSIFGEDYPTKDGTCVRDYIHIDDLANAHLEALSYLLATRESNIFNVGYCNGYSVKEVINLVKEISGVDFRVDIATRRSGDPAELIANNAKILTSTQWKAKYNDLSKIIASAYQWEKSLC